MWSRRGKEIDNDTPGTDPTGIMMTNGTKYPILGVVLQFYKYKSVKIMLQRQGDEEEEEKGNPSES